MRKEFKSVSEFPAHFCLKSGAVVLPTSAHALKFSDGTVFNPTARVLRDIREFWRDLKIVNYQQVHQTDGGVAQEDYVGVCPAGLSMLYRFQRYAKGKPIMLLVSYKLIHALKQQGVRRDFKNVIAQQPTLETRGLPIGQKIIDADRWVW